MKPICTIKTTHESFNELVVYLGVRARFKSIDGNTVGIEVADGVYVVVDTLLQATKQFVDAVRSGS